jgi:hypothetical protein
MKTRLMFTIGAFLFGLVMTLLVMSRSSQADDATQVAVGELVLDPRLTLPIEQLDTLADPNHGYTYQIPATWQSLDANGGGRGAFLNYISVASTEAQPSMDTPNGTVFLTDEPSFAMDFAVHRAAKFLPESETFNSTIDERSLATGQAILPYLPEGEVRTIGDYTVLIISNEEPLMMAGDGRYPYITTLYFLVDQAVYYFWIAYAPPTNLDKAGEGWSTYNQIVNTILYSFEVDKNAPFFVNQPPPFDPNSLYVPTPEIMPTYPLPTYAYP